MLVFPADAGNRTGVYGVLNLLFGGAFLIIHFRKIVVVIGKHQGNCPHRRRS